MAFYAKNQTEGKGQRGKRWISNPNENIILSVILHPPAFFMPKPFVFNAFLSNCCRSFIQTLIPEPVKIKWPNDMYIGDRKAAGLLVENIYQGNTWAWSVVGMGININQTHFDESVNQASSVAMLTGLSYDCIALSKQLHKELLNAFNLLQPTDETSIMDLYNQHLYKKGMKQKFKQQGKIFETEVVGVNAYGQLLCADNMQHAFEFGSLEWIIQQ